MMKHKIVGSVIEVILDSGQLVKISREDKIILSEFPSWRLNGGYVMCTRMVETVYSSVTEKVYLARAIAIRTLGRKNFTLQVDHRDRDILNNVRTNLRMATPSQNAANRRAKPNKTGFRGVNKSYNRYRVYISGPGKKRISVGTFDSAEDAAHAYDQAARAHFGPFAVLNFPDEDRA